LEQVSEILDDMLRKIPRERKYNAVFGKIAEILTQKYSLTIPALDLRFRFTLFMQEEFDAVPKDQWKLYDPAWIAEKEQKAKVRLLSWIEEQIKESAKSM
jgi:hypothetical protein